MLISSLKKKKNAERRGTPTTMGDGESTKHSQEGGRHAAPPKRRGRRQHHLHRRRRKAAPSGGGGRAAPPKMGQGEQGTTTQKARWNAAPYLFLGTKGLRTGTSFVNDVDPPIWANSARSGPYFLLLFFTECQHVVPVTVDLFLISNQETIEVHRYNLKHLSKYNSNVTKCIRQRRARLTPLPLSLPFSLSQGQQLRRKDVMRSAHVSTSTCHKCTNSFALAQVVPQNRVSFRVDTLESLRDQAQDRGSSSSHSSNRIVNRHGHHSRFHSMSAAVETRNDRRDTTIESGSERHNQWQTGHVEQHRHSAPECVSEANCFQGHTEAVTTFQQTGKAATTKDNFETSCRTGTCVCKRGQTKEKQWLSALRAPTSRR